MAVATVNINAVDNMSSTLAGLQSALNNLQRQANNIVIGGNAQNAQNAFTNMNAQARILESTMNRLGNVVWNQFTSALKDAYKEIKNIDDELVVVRRVTGKTAKELEGMTKNAFQVAQRYGVSASDYLAGVAQFTRAGYGEQAEGLAELSVQLQRAGDVSANVANQYMTAVDKAYNMQGSVEALTAAMDGANQIGNEYATTVGEIAAGIGKVASIAATGHVGIDELTAALGTVTAVTQRSGTEAATALRAIFLNIMGDTQTEIEEGAKWTAGEIEGLRDVLEMYAPDVVAAAEATESLIDPMEAIGALAKSYKDGVLTESKLFTMVSDIGGKLRTNQLMVLIKNWDMYQSMLGTFANASGSIAKEIENSMDSITVKTEQLKAAWTAMVSDTMSTEFIKGFLDGLIDCVNAAGNLQTVLALVLGIVTTLKAQRLGTLFAGITKIFGGTASAASFASAFTGIGLAVTAVTSAITIANGVIQAHNERMEKMAQGAQEQSSEAARSSEEITKLYSVYASATAGSKEYETALRALAEALGLTAEQAQNAGESIAELTAQQLKQAVADAKAAMDIWSSANRNKWGGQSYNILFGGEGFADEDIARIVNNYYDQMSQYASDAWRDEYVLGASWTLRANEDAERLVAAYESALNMQKEMNQYGLDHGIEDLTDIPGYDVLVGYISDLESTYASAKAVVDSYVSSVANLAVVSMSAFGEMSKAEKSVAEGNEVNAESAMKFAEAMDALAGSFKDGTFMGERTYSAVLSQMAKLFPNLVKYSKEYSTWVGKDSTGDLAHGAESAAESVNHLTQALSTAMKAKQAFDKVMEQTPRENEGFKDYQSAYASYAAEIEAGRINSAIAMAAARYLMAGSGKYDFDALYASGGYGAVNAAMKKGPWQTVYGNGDKEYGEGFIDLLAKYADKSGKIMDAAGENVIATYSKVGQQVKFSIDDMQALSEVTGLSLNQIYHSVEALGVYGDTTTGLVKDQMDLLEAMGKEAGITLSDTTGRLVVDYEKLRQFMQETGKTEGDWDSMKQWLDLLNEIDMITLTNVPDVEKGWQNYKDWAADAAESAEAAAESMQEATDAAEKTVEEVSEADFSKASVGATEQAANNASAAAQAMYDEYSDILGKIKELIAGPYDLTFTTNGAVVINTIDIIETEAGQLTRERTIEFDVNGNVVSVLDVLKDEAGEVAGTRTIHYNADGTISYIEDVARTADTAGRDRWIYYYTNGEISGIAKIITTAGPNGAAREQHIHYYTDGSIENIETVIIGANGAAISREIAYYTNGLVSNIQYTYETAEGPINEDWTIQYDADGNIIGIAQVYTRANDPTSIIREFQYSANGKIQGVRELTTNAEGVTHEKVYEFQFGADGKLLRTKVTEFDTYLDGTTSEPYSYILDATDKDAKEILLDATAAVEAVTGTQADYDYNLGADPKGVEKGLEEAGAAIEKATETPKEFKLAGKDDGVIALLEKVAELIRKIPSALKIVLGFDGTDDVAKAVLDKLREEIQHYQEEANTPSQAEGGRSALRMGYDRNSGKFVEYYQGTGADGTYQTWAYHSGPDMNDALQKHVELRQFYNEAGEAVKQWTVTIFDELGNVISSETYDFDQWDQAVVDFAERTEEAVVDAISSAQGDADTVVIPGTIELEPLTDEEAQQEATGGKPLKVKAIPNIVGEYTGGMIDHSEDGRYMTFNWKVDLVDSDDVIEIFDEIDNETGEEHKITIYTEADGTQTVEEFIRELDENGDLVDKTYTTTFDADGNIITTLETTEQLLAQLDDMYDITFQTNANSVSSKLDELRRKANQLDGKTVTITTVVKGDTLPDQEVDNNAEGTDNFRGGLSLINEEGPELVVSGGRAAILGNGRTTIAAIPKGARIYTAEETADILHGINRLAFPAFANGLLSGDITLPKDKPKEDEKKEENSGGNSGNSGSSGSSSEDEDKFWDTIKEYLDYGLKKLDYAIKDYESRITLLERARDKILDPIDTEIRDLEYSVSMLEYEIRLLERARDEATKPLDQEIDRLRKLRNINKEDEAIEEKKLAVEQARADLEEARRQRTVRYFNESTGQWEWMADQKAITDAQTALEKAEKDYADAMEDYQITLLERQRDEIAEQFDTQITALEDQEDALKNRIEDLQHQETMINYEYEQAIKPLQDQMETLQNQYDDLEQFYNRLVDAVDVPTESLTAALQQMGAAAENYASQLENTIALLNTLYELAPTWSPVEMGDLGAYAAHANTYGDYTVDNSTNVYINGIQVPPEKAGLINTALKKAGIYNSK